MMVVDGKADWIWDEELNLHIPCCSRWVTTTVGSIRKCGNGPLTGNEIVTGTCGERPHIDSRQYPSK
jgi:hypothetical protein